MSKLKLLFFSLWAGVASAFALVPTGVTEDSMLSYDAATDAFSFEWQSRVGWTYFLQQSTDLMEFNYVPIIEPGTGQEIAWGFSVNLPNYDDAIFMRLKMTDVPMGDVWLDDADGDGFGNQLELDLGTDPLDVTDADDNGIPDDIDAVWYNSVPSVWKQAIVNDPNAAYYDPDNLIATENDLLPGDDYDGDGINNLTEWKNGSSAMDYFNGATGVWLRITSAEGENVAPSTFIEPKIKVEVLSSGWDEYINAPVLFSTENSYAGLAGTQDPSETLSATYLAKTGYSGAKTEFYAPATLGPQEVTASLPNGVSITATVYVVSASSVAKLPTRNFRITETFDDGSQTFAWTSDDDEGDWFHIVEERLDGTFEILFETTYGSAELPYVSGQNTYSITLDKNYQLIAP